MRVLFLALAFMAVFVLELVSSRRVHAVQYLFVGLAMIFFYVLLLSLAEQIGFASPICSPRRPAAACCRSTSARCSRAGSRALAMAAVFAVLYGLLYLILSLEDYALLAGAILGFAALTTVMFATLRVDGRSGPARRRPQVPAE